MDAHGDTGTTRGCGATFVDQPGVRTGTVVERPDPGCEVGHGTGRRGPGDRRAEPDPGVHAGQSLTEPRPTPTDTDLDLHGRLETVDVGAIQESDLDESHGGEDSVPGAVARHLSPRSRPGRV